jgi:hypothetical protein
VGTPRGILLRERDAADFREDAEEAGRSAEDAGKALAGSLNLLIQPMSLHI